MTTKEILLKYTYIIERVKKGDYPSLDAIIEDVARRFNAIDKEVELSERTFLRDKNEIADLYNIDICYSRRSKGYYINYTTDSHEHDRTLDAFNLFLTLNEASRQDLKNLIVPDSRCMLGVENIYGLLHAIRHLLIIRFAYQKFDEESSTFRTIAPYTLKESQGRWYLVGKDREDGVIKVFGLDRISAVVVSQETFKMDKSYNPTQFFENRFGVDASCENKSVVRVVLSFGPLEGKYLVSKPFHHTQRIISNGVDQFIISVDVYPSYDFFMALLSYGDRLKVMEPAWVAQELKDRHLAAAQLYL